MDRKKKKSCKVLSEVMTQIIITTVNTAHSVPGLRDAPSSELRDHAFRWTSRLFNDEDTKCLQNT